MAMRLIRGVMIHMASFIVNVFNPSARFSFLLLSLCGTLYSTAAYAVFTTPGQFSVGGDGSATYNIPIQVPPGTAGMAPKLSLTYSSSGANGILGMGWGIDGLSQISRCPTTLIQDGQINGVNYTATDRFCIDGQRLIATTDTYNATTKIHTSTAAYGANNTEYKTESANFAKIISYGTAGTGPAYFKVWTKGGQVIEYGNTADSRIEAAGIATARTWGVNKISDTKGNYMTITYTEDNPNGEAYVNRIDYTGNATSAPVLATYASVQFTYVTRVDTTTDYLAGLVIKSTKRMTNVKTYNGATLVKDYRLTYTNNGTNHFNTSNVADGSLLTKLQECDGATTPVCQNPTNLAWTIAPVNSNTFAAAQSWSTGGLATQAVGDINGDGRADVTGTNASGQRLFALSTGTAFAAPIVIESSTTNTFLGDVNGDGLADLIYANGTVRLSSGSGFGALQTWVSGLTVRAVGDVNGDGRADVSGINASGQHLFSLSTGSAFSVPVLIEATSVAYHMGDFNGDGFADLIYPSGNVRLSNGSGFGTEKSWGIGNIASVGDVNGDGRADVIYTTLPSAGQNYVTALVAISTGSYFSTIPIIVAKGPPCIIYAMIGVCPNYVGVAVLLGDFNGDGLADLLNGNYVSFAVTPVPDQLTAITNGYGAASTISYKKISDTTVYTPETGAVYPVRDVLPAVPLYVVSSYTSSDGIGGVVATNYKYGGLKAHLTGRGSLGFGYVVESSPDSNISITTFYRQDYPFIGLPYQTEKRAMSTNNMLSLLQNGYANTDLSTGTMVSKFPYLSQSVEQAFEAGTLINTTTTTNQYDNFGNATQISVNSGDGYIKTTNNVYANDTTNWFLGRLIRSTVTSTTP